MVLKSEPSEVKATVLTALVSRLTAASAAKRRPAGLPHASESGPAHVSNAAVGQAARCNTQCAEAGGSAHTGACEASE